MGGRLAKVVTKECGTCQHWLKVEGGLTVGECWRYPPQVMLVSLEMKVMSSIPRTFRDRLCGEWLQKRGSSA